MEDTAQSQETHLTPDELATRWHMVTGTLTNWRSAGTGPTYTKIGRSILYPIEAILAYEKQNTVA